MLLANGRFWVKVDQLAAAEMITPKEKGTGIIKLIFNNGAILLIDCGSTQKEDFNRLWRAMDICQLNKLIIPKRKRED